MERTMLGPGNCIDLLLVLWQQDAISEDEYDLDELIGEVIDIHGEPHASSPATEEEVEASNLSTLVDTEETTRRLAWHNSSAVSRRVNDLERANRGRYWDPAWGTQPAGMTAARMAAISLSGFTCPCCGVYIAPVTSGPNSILGIRSANAFRSSI